MSEHFIVAEARRARERRESMRHGQVGAEPDDMTLFLIAEASGLIDNADHVEEDG